MSFEIISKFVKVLQHTSYFCIFWQVSAVTNMKKLEFFFRPVPSHIVTDNFGQIIFIFLKLVKECITTLF